MGLDGTGRTALALARQAVEEWVRIGLLAEPPREVPPSLRERSGAFVSLRAGGDLRGCIGTLGPTRVSLAHEIIASVVAAATRDPRFAPVTPGELGGLSYEVDLIGPLEPAGGVGDLDPKLYGVVVEGAAHRGVLLPDLAGVESAGQQVTIARAKAGLAPDAPVRLFRFQVRRFVDDREATA